jgi:cytochrome c oxidase subunit 2
MLELLTVSSSLFRWLPAPASDYGHWVDDIHELITILSVFFTVSIVGTMLYFATKYRRRNGVDHETPHIHGSVLLEVIWTAVPTLICIVVAAAGYLGYEEMRTPPANEEAVEINVWGQQWAWSFEYPNGKKTSGEFVVPVGKPIKLIMSSRDVLHSFFVPSMRAKMDVINGRFTTLWFRPIVTGPQIVFCTEYCGTAHSNMMATMRVVGEDEYQRWVSDKGKEQSPAELGKALYAQNACNSCHSLDGNRLVGPSFLNLYGRKGKFSDGKEYEASEDYLRESILYPAKNVVEGYGPPSPMPAYEGRLSDEELSHIIAFIKSVKGEAKAAPTPIPVSAGDAAKMSPTDRGKALHAQKACIGCHSVDGTPMVGPTWKGLYGKNGKFDDGSSYIADDAYLKGSILRPQENIVQGFMRPSSMPSYEGQLSDSELNDIIEYIKTLK